MKPDLFLSAIVDPTLKWLASSLKIPVNDQARVLVMTIAGQESAWKYRRQIGGPARSFWQFERHGGVAEVFQKQPDKLSAVCAVAEIPFDPDTVYEAMAWNDLLACSMARLLLWGDPAPLPALGDKEGAWDTYILNWRPGAPHHDTWSGLYDQSVAAIGSSNS